MPKSSRNENSVFKERAPGLHWTIARTFGAEALLQFERCFALVASSGGFNEGNVVRPEGASFNPRPARLCHILFNESQERRAVVLQAAMLVTAQPPKEPPPDEFAVPQELAEAALGYFRTNLDRPEAELIATALELDIVRHLHMSTLSPQDRTKTLERIRGQILPAIRHGNSARLKLMLEASVNRLQPQFPA